MMVWTKLTMAKDHVHREFGLYILRRGGLGGTFVYPSRARKPPVGRRNEGSKDPPRREARDVVE